MSILVIGLSGFVGSHCAEQMPVVDLADRDGRVDLRDAERVKRAVRSLTPVAVLHLAAESSIPASVEDPRQTYKVNIEIDPDRLRPAEQRRMRGSYEKLRADTGWAPEIPFGRTLQDMVEYWDQRD